MEVERIAGIDGKVALWAFEWDSCTGHPAKINRQLLGYEQPVRATKEISDSSNEAICWSHGRTLGNIAVFADEILNSLSGDRGEDKILACDIVEAGKMRNGAKRWWCRTHQRHWGTKADIANASKSGLVQCSNHMQTMSYVVNPPSIRLEDHSEVAISCSLPPAVSSAASHDWLRPKLHIEAWMRDGQRKAIDEILDAMAVEYDPGDDLFSRSEARKVQITPPAAFEFVMGLESGLEMDCINCRNCGHPHLDIGEFGRNPHSKHLCGNCGRDNTWSRGPIVSTPLKPLHDRSSHETGFIDAAGVFNLDDQEGFDFEIRPTVPAIVWTARRPQERGVHVRLFHGNERIIDKVFNAVIFRGRILQRAALLHEMVSRTIV
ncbi:hypothetical protein FHR23_003200 [Stakelama sediminis]|uniref:Uncharacterized protein n=1 Tax=Stakelama sediminis TaxID=463200 RepID=A0A840Z3B7_9SPHN|nr:hypothetical protein [Stakelama sediminis]MBB5720237.1 hypothetical protein [Stakelama sediminis]